MNEHYLLNRDAGLDRNQLTKKFVKDGFVNLGTDSTYLTLTSLTNESQDFPIPGPAEQVSWKLDFVFDLRGGRNAKNVKESILKMPELVQGIDTFVDFLEFGLDMPEKIVGSTESRFILNLIKRLPEEILRGVSLNELDGFDGAKTMILNFEEVAPDNRSEKFVKILNAVRENLQTRLSKLNKGKDING